MEKKIIYIDDVDKTNEIKKLSLKDDKYEIVFINSPKIYEYRASRVKIYDNQLTKKSSQHIFDYYKEIAKRTSLEIETDDGDFINILSSQYEKISKVSPNTVLGSFLDGNYKTKEDNECIIYPFGINLSQKEAVEKAINNQISIINGPPGTGKTQTILNIVANAIIRNKKVAVVSNNNSAITNVLEKLEKYDLSFLSALLGNKKNRESFIKKQSGKYPNDLSTWKLDKDDNTYNSIKQLEEEIVKMLRLNNELATYKLELQEYGPEKYYYEENLKENNYEKLYIKGIEKLSKQRILSLIIDLEYLDLKNINILQKIRIFFKYGSNILRFVNSSIDQLIKTLHSYYYEITVNDLEKRIADCECRLNNYNFIDKFNKLSEMSLIVFKDYLAKKYNKNISRQIYKLYDLDKNSTVFVNDYPIILSTTHSIKRSLNFDYIYDYLIIDESSQVDLVTGALALSCAKNVVIVGDNKQLPNVVDKVNFEKISVIDNEFQIEDKYRFLSNKKPHTLLDAACDVWDSIPKTTLKEHYRCNPKIINFCNLMFYNGELTVLNNDDTEKPLSLYLTAEGNHARGHYNQRQIDVIKEEILPELKKRGFDDKDIGIIAPYNDQVDELKKQIRNKCQIDTVHKYQGREKDAIILSSVDNAITDFGDDPNLLNVAISRAKKSLSVVISDNEENWNTNYGQLKKYIEYNNLEIKHSEISSVFDLLYKNKKNERDKYIKNHRRVSKYDSENLLQGVIDEILGNEDYKNIYCRNHYYLFDLINDYSILGEDEISYCKNGSHLDYLLFNRMNKLPILAIELDGTAFHKAGSIQSARDELKDSILAKINMPLIRIKTNESMEKETIKDELNKILGLR